MCQLWHQRGLHGERPMNHAPSRQLSLLLLSNQASFLQPAVTRLLTLLFTLVLQSTRFLPRRTCPLLLRRTYRLLPDKSPRCLSQQMPLRLIPHRPSLPVPPAETQLLLMLCCFVVVVCCVLKQFRCFEVDAPRANTFIG